MFKKFKALETSLATYALYWGVVLLLPYETFGTDSYSGMIAVAPEPVWGVFALCIGVAQLFGMLQPNKKVKGVFLLTAAGFWYFVFSMFMIVNPFTTGGTYIIVAFLCSYLFVKVGGLNG